MLPLPKPSSAPTRWLFKVQRLLQTDKGEEDTICLGEANCKQFCYSTAFYLTAGTDRPHCWSAARALGARGHTEAEFARSQFFLPAWKLAAGGR